jgi:hypothetical protein
MRRKTFDALLASGGVVVAIILIVAGGLLTWASSFVSDQVHDQLVAQKIYFPDKGSDALKSDEIGPHLDKYAGQQLATGAQAEAYANHFIAVHLEEMTGGKTYAELSSAAQADPTNTELAAQVNTVFKGETLRGLLLNAYAFGTMGSLAGIAAIVSFVGAAVMLLLSGLGFFHARRTPEEREVLAGHHPLEPARV